MIRYLPKGARLYDCPVHGKFTAHYKTANPLCPLCDVSTGKGNGTTASDVELFINLKNAVQKELSTMPPLTMHSVGM